VYLELKVDIKALGGLLIYDPIYTNEFNKYKYELKFSIDNIETSSKYIEDLLKKWMC